MEKQAGPEIGGEAEQNLSHRDATAERFELLGGKSDQPYIYFLMSEDKRCLKVGYSTRLRVRISALSGEAERIIGCRFNLLGTLPANEYPEMDVLRMFREAGCEVLPHSREWFCYSRKAHKVIKALPVDRRTWMERERDRHFASQKSA